MTPTTRDTHIQHLASVLRRAHPGPRPWPGALSSEGFAAVLVDLDAYPVGAADEARKQERERLAARVEALPTLPGWVEWDEALVPTAPPYVDRAAVLSILRGEDS